MNELPDRIWVYEGGWSKTFGGRPANTRAIRYCPEANLVTAQELLALVDKLFPAIAHGNAEHQEWLEKAIQDHFAGNLVEKPRGKGTKDSLVDELIEAAESVLLRFCQGIHDSTSECYKKDLHAAIAKIKES